MDELVKFVCEHLNDDISRLILNRNKWPEIDIDMAISCIESRRKLKGKIQEWYDLPELIFPVKLSAEQCSSSATGRYKADLAQSIADTNGVTRWKIADLTGGLGADSWFFSQKAEAVLYNEMQNPLCEAAKHNFKVLGVDNISISNHTVIASGISGKTPDNGMTPSDLLASFDPDIVYLDPARRGEGGKKVFLIEECTPDILTLKDEIFSISRHILLKLSPMADITMVCRRLGNVCREVHVVAAGGECKELLIWMDREWNDEYEIIAAELHNDRSYHEFRFMPSEEAEAKGQILISGNALQADGSYLFEPGKALMKSGCFNLITKKYGIAKLGISTHYYIVGDKEKAEELKGLGKIFRIISISSLDKRSIKAAGRDYPRAEVSARNIPMDTEALKKKLGVTSGDDAHIFGLKSDSAGNLLIVTERI
jgi:hypothetical protein